MVPLRSSSSRAWRRHREIAEHRLLQWWRKKGLREWLIAVAGFGLLVFALLLATGSVLRPAIGDLLTSATLVPLTLLRNAKQIGAVCLDGSAPGYHFQSGKGTGARSWVIYVEGGGWCESVTSCSKRKYTAVGSSKYMERAVPFQGILSNDESQNPDFFNWNKVKIRYCDGASFSGDVEVDNQNGSRLFFRGQRVWNAVTHELLLKGLAYADQVLLSGCSAGGLATLLHCDRFRSLLPKDTTVKCLSDGGYFLDEKDISGENTMRSFYQDVVHLQDAGKNLQEACTSKNEPWQCFFPREIVKHTRTPIFVLNAAYDWWQIGHVLVPKSSDPSQDWQKCRNNIRYCDAKQLRILDGFREKLLDSLNDFRKKGGQVFVHSCFVHCQAMSHVTWHGLHSPRINNKTIAEAVGSWFFDREVVSLIDDLYPHNPTCRHKEFIS